jgi:hypothetical protein
VNYIRRHAANKKSVMLSGAWRDSRIVAAAACWCYGAALHSLGRNAFRAERKASGKVNSRWRARRIEGGELMIHGGKVRKETVLCRAAALLASVTAFTQTNMCGHALRI